MKQGLSAEQVEELRNWAVMNISECREAMALQILLTEMTKPKPREGWVRPEHICKTLDEVQARDGACGINLMKVREVLDEEV